jgi:hypothetical protein
MVFYSLVVTVTTSNMGASFSIRLESIMIMVPTTLLGAHVWVMRISLSMLQRKEILF